MKTALSVFFTILLSGGFVAFVGGVLYAMKCSWDRDKDASK